MASNPAKPITITIATVRNHHGESSESSSVKGCAASFIAHLQGKPKHRKPRHAENKTINHEASHFSSPNKAGTRARWSGPTSAVEQSQRLVYIIFYLCESTNPHLISVDPQSR